ncbi:MAG: class I tRNA ligase family protein [Candidatus Hodgkinia cicadicola]
MFKISLPEKAKRRINESALCYQCSNQDWSRTGRGNRKKFRLLDGPPYANGELHMGHVMNRVLKHISLLSQDALGKKADSKYNWDCHGLPIEAEVIKQTGRVDCLPFLCKIYAMNWMKTQMLQLKILGINASKPKSTMTASAQKLIVSEVVKLIKAGRVAFGKRAAVWDSVEDEVVSENDIQKRPASAADASVSFVISRRRQLMRRKTATVLQAFTSMIGPRFKLLGRALKTDSSEIWTLPWVTSLNVPNSGLKSAYLMPPPVASLIPAQLTKQLTVLNVFNGTHMPVISTCHKQIVAAGPTSKAAAVLKLSTAVRSISKYSTQFRRRVINPKTSTVVGEIYVVNKLLTRGLIESCEVTRRRQMVIRRTGALAVRCASGQWYIKIDNDTRNRVRKMLTSVKFVPPSAAGQLLKLVGTRPDWIISRQRLWGVPLCFNRNRSNKATWDEAFVHRIWALFNKRKEHAWHKLRGLLSGYSGQNWRKETGVLDVWFDASAVSVLRGKQLPWHMVIEGTDQHRGWFQSVLLSCALTRNQLAFKTLIAHPFVMVNKAEKMSKSKRGLCLKRLSSDNLNVIRVWVASTSLTENQVLSSGWMLKSVNIYSKIRNTLKWAVGVVGGEKPKLSHEVMTSLDRWAWQRLWLCANRIATLYLRCNLRAVIRKIAEACGELSAVYFSTAKDALYCDFKTSCLRSNKIAVIELALTLTSVWLTPILPAYAELISSTIKLSNNVMRRQPAAGYSGELTKRWLTIARIKRAVNKLRIISKTKPQSFSLLTLNILTDCKRTLATFKNVDSASVLGCAKVNIVFTDNPSGLMKTTRRISIALARNSLRICSRCRRALFDNEF